MFRFRFVSFFRFASFSFFLAAAQLLGPGAHATTPAPPTNPSEQCQVILKYEGLCGNSRPNPCLNKPGVDYFGNLAQQKTWDNYYWLCVNTPGDVAQRYSHECIQKLGIGATCTSTVPALVEYQAVTTVHAEAQVYQERPKYEAVTQVSATYCMMLAETGETIRKYHLACGDVPAAQCSKPEAGVADFQAACGTKKPCECVKAFGCRADYCPTAPSPATPATPASPAEPATPAAPGETAPGGDGTPGGGGGMPVPGSEAGNDNFLLGAPEATAPDKSGGAAATGKASGCALQPEAKNRADLSLLMWFMGALVPILGLRGPYFFKSLSRR
ncbi:MAG: hypothetical protein IT572_00625 [Deltaproteobacteria bacterium]|nr:hypothetical protein [Deltaproteobacteria bacterium]